jgi:hypothetical protein
MLSFRRRRHGRASGAVRSSSTRSKRSPRPRASREGFTPVRLNRNQPAGVNYFQELSPCPRVSASPDLRIPASPHLPIPMHLRVTRQCAGKLLFHPLTPTQSFLLSALDRGVQPPLRQQENDAHHQSRETFRARRPRLWLPPEVRA